MLLVVLLVVDAGMFQGDRFAGAEIHPFGAVVLLMAVQYGLPGGVFAAVTSTIALYSFNLPTNTPGADYFDTLAPVLETPTLWLGAAVVLGGLRNLQLAREREAQRRCETAEALATELSQSLRIAVSEISSLERRIASDTATVDSLIAGLSRLDRSSPRAFGATARDIIADVCGASAHAIYDFGNANFRMIAAHDEENSSPPTRMLWTSREELLAQFSQNPEPIGSGHPNAPSLLAPGAHMMAPIGDVGFVVIERLRPGNALSEDRLSAVAAALAALWPQARGVSAAREGAAAWV